MRGLGGAVARPGPSSLYQNVTAHPSTASVPITVLLYNGPLLCSLNVPGDDQLVCSVCQSPLTVKHFLIECVNFAAICSRYFSASSMKDVFENVNAQSVIDFIFKKIIFITNYNLVISFYKY